MPFWNEKKDKNTKNPIKPLVRYNIYKKVLNVMKIGLDKANLKKFTDINGRKAFLRKLF